MLKKLQAERLKVMKNELGVFGEAWTRRLYPEENIYYEGGGPHRFWLHVDTEVVWNLTMFINASEPDPLSVEEFALLREGSLVLARFSDQQIYRAQVEKVLLKSGQKTVRVRFFDYGNSDQVGVESLYRWEERYDLIKPQAVACALASCLVEQISQDLSEEFSSTMRSFGKMGLRVVKVLHSGDSVRTCLGGKRRSGPDLLVQLTKDDACVATSLKQSTLLREMFAVKDEAVFIREDGMSFREKVEHFLSYEGERDTPPPPEIIHHQVQNKKKKEGKSRASVADSSGGLQTERKIGRKKVDQEDPPSFPFPAEDIRAEYKEKVAKFIPPRPVKSPGLKIQLGEVLSFRMSYIKDTEEFYILPGQRYSQRVKVQPQPGQRLVPAMAEEVELDTVWMVKLEDFPERCLVLQVDREAGTVDLQGIDSGLQQSGLPLSHLFRVPDGPARDLPGLVVRCHLSGLFSKSREATEIMRDLFPSSKEVEARLTDLFNGESFGLDVICPNMEIFNDVLVTLNLAEVSFQEISGSLDVKMETETAENNWDPMADDYMDYSNNYKTTDEDIGFATDGYRSKQVVCPFFQNYGRCYKGELCEDKHVQLRAAAVTADKEEVVINTLDQPEIPSRDRQVLLWISHIYSPSNFYVTFPHGDRDILTLSEEARKARHSREFLALFAEMQESYQGQSRGHGMESLPSLLALLAVRLGDQTWHRASLRQDEDQEGNLEVFLVDSGRLETVPREDVRKLQDRFTILPFQAHQAELNLLEPRSGGWRQEAAVTMRTLAEGCGHTSGRVVKVLLDEKLVMDVNTVRGEEEEEEDIGKRLCDLGLANRLVEIEQNQRAPG